MSYQERSKEFLIHPLYYVLSVNVIKKSENCRLEYFYSHNPKRKCIYLVLEKLDAKDINGIEIYLNGDAMRFDIYKLQKNAAIDQELVENVCRKLAPILNIPIDNILVDGEIDEVIIIKRKEDFIGREYIFNEIDKRLSTKNKTILLYGLPGNHLFIVIFFIIF